MGFGNRNTKSAKLTLGRVAEIRARYEQGETQGSLARVYGVSIGQIGRIVRGESWQQREAQAPIPVPSAGEVLARVLQRMENGNLVQGMVKGEELAEKPENWEDGLTEEERRIASSMMEYGVDGWKARENILATRKTLK